MKKHESQHELYPWEQTRSENQMNEALWAWVLEKAWKLNTMVFRKKEFENDAGLNSEPMK